jgi:predicted TIM-barrel fold metal-dependent hydrolase
VNPSPIAREYLEQGQSVTCPIIDMHGHLGPFYGCYLPSSPLERMRHRLKRCGVRRIVCSHHSALACDAERGNALMQEVVREHPDEFLGYWVINPNDPEATARDLRSFDGRGQKGDRTSQITGPAPFLPPGFVGFKFWPDYHLVPVTSAKYAPALEYADAHGLLVLVHTFGESPFDAPGMLAEVGKRYPQARFLMGHSGYGEWERSVEVARELANVYLDLTSVFQALDFAQMPGGSLMPRAAALSPHVNGLIEYMVATAGSEKVVFGSDLPWYSQHYHAGAVLFAHISDEARHDILHRNAERLLGQHLPAE